MHLSDARFSKILTITIMLLPDNIHPENCIYYNGSFVLEELKKGVKYSIIDLYQIVKNKKKMSFSVFVLCIDWLYLLEVAKLNSDGEIELCS